jgi:NAD+ kinase
MGYVGIVAKEENGEAARVAFQVAEMLMEEDMKVIVYPSTLEMPPDAVKVQDRREVRGDFVVCIGGDGTILKTLLYLKPSSTPILGIGIGERNFLATVEKSDFMEAVQRVLRGDYSLDEEMRLEARTERMDFPPALNEVYITSLLPGKTMKARVEAIRAKGRRTLWIDRADGVIIATPIGSTAYSLSAGGPIVDTTLEALTVTPINPLVHRPSIVISAREELVMGARDGALLVLDGQIRERVEGGEEITVKMSDEPANIITFEEEPRFRRIARGFRT